MRWRLVTVAALLGLALPSLGPTGPADAVAAPARTDRQCAGVNFSTTVRDQQLADDLMGGRLTIAPFDDWTLPDDPDWTENPFTNSTWVFHYHSLHWADPLRRVALATGDAAMLKRYQAIVRDWYDDNPPGQAPSGYSWYDMAVGFRAIGLVCLRATFETVPAWVDETIARHVEALTDPAQYAGRGNHALFQNLGLLALGCSLGRDRWRDLAVERAETLLATAVDEEGVTDEGSTLYQALNHEWYLQLDYQLQECGLPPPAMFDRVRKMPDFLAHATQPDKHLVAFGDTSAVQRGASFPGTTSQYAMTDGQLGPKPDRTFALYQRGYAFSRSGWFDTQPAAMQSLASIRFGTPKSLEVHGHEDSGALGYFAFGRQVLWQPGLWGGAGGPVRRYVLSNQAHNTIDIAGAAYDPTVATPVVAAAGSPAADLVSLDSPALEGATWRRTMVHAKAPELLVVDDRVIQHTNRSVLQRWHLGADRTVVASRCGRADTSGPGSDATFLWIGGCPRLSVATGRTSPLLGWRSPQVNEFEPTPTLVARTRGRLARVTTIIVPRPSGVRPRDVEVLWSRLGEAGGAVDVRIGTRVHRVRFSTTSATVRPERSTSSTSAVLRRAPRGRDGTLGRLLVEVRAATGETPTGRVSVTLGRHTLTGRLRDGATTVRLPHLRDGRYRLRTAYAGSSAVRPSKAPARIVHVRSRR